VKRKPGLHSQSPRVFFAKSLAFTPIEVTMTINNENHSYGVVLLSPGAILQSRYRIVRQLGRGGMGAVYEAIDLRLGHTVALKQTLTQSSEVWKQFEREACLMAQLNHPALPRVSDYFIESNRAFFVMQYVEGPDLADIIAQQPGPMPQQTVVAWADQLLDALVYLHSHDRQIIHRDIKPHNLKLTSTGKIALLDFGLAKSHGGDAADDGGCRSIFGYSPRYAPLEQIQDLGTSPQSDIYALGATLYHLLTGFKPVDAITRASALIGLRPNPLKPAHEINGAVSPELSAILSRAMEQNPRDRYHSAAEFREALRRIGRDEEEQHQCSGHQSGIEDTVLSTTIVKAARSNTLMRFRTHAVTSILLILLAGFGVFCRYYSWKLPQHETRGMSYGGSLAVSSAIEGDRSRSQSRKDRSLSQQ
jgi:serine/threonine protein kinase